MNNLFNNKRNIFYINTTWICLIGGKTIENQSNQEFYQFVRGAIKFGLFDEVSPTFNFACVVVRVSKNYSKNNHYYESHIFWLF